MAWRLVEKVPSGGWDLLVDVAPRKPDNQGSIPIFSFEMAKNIEFTEK
jgi:hypothetical protein